MKVPDTIAALARNLKREIGPDDALLGWDEAELSEYLAESFEDALGEPDLVAFTRRSIALWLVWAEHQGGLTNCGGADVARGTGFCSPVAPCCASLCCAPSQNFVRGLP